MTVHTLAAVLSDRLLALEHDLFGRLEASGRSQWRTVARNTDKRWRRKRDVDAVLRGLTSDTPTTRWQTLGQTFLRAATRMSWTSLEAEMALCEKALGRGYEGVAREGMDRLDRTAMTVAVCDEWAETVTEGVGYWLGAAQALTGDAVKGGLSGELLLESLEPEWRRMIVRLKGEARRVEFQLVNGVRAEAIGLVDAAAVTR